MLDAALRPPGFDADWTDPCGCDATWCQFLWTLSKSSRIWWLSHTHHPLPDRLSARHIDLNPRQALEGVPRRNTADERRWQPIGSATAAPLQLLLCFKEHSVLLLSVGDKFALKPRALWGSSSIPCVHPSDLLELP
jgi:hypothetical protein